MKKEKYYFNYSDTENIIYKPQDGLKCVNCNSDKMEPSRMLTFFRVNASVDIVCSDCNSIFTLLLNDGDFEFISK
ncbi:hypothetical protein [Turicibacter sanguinis]|uniref:hypothetical protein n=1 Tax=Turicibacter sanguinis TaxID=154288 RepID=UPI00232E580C|nr:hypothetical protein [Turicibacter sanguinis]MDB8437735.1 hypothetical protein [Turicibacter sanguinis]